MFFKPSFRIQFLHTPAGESLPLFGRLGGRELQLVDAKVWIPTPDSDSHASAGPVCYFDTMPNSRVNRRSQVLRSLYFTSTGSVHRIYYKTYR